MPIRDGKRYCINHTNSRMNRTERLKALTNVQGTGTDAKLDQSSGLVLMPFVCEECGYLELYVADKTQRE
jgi:predicted nucleic-acid-binding Zn-ribbon protein